MRVCAKCLILRLRACHARVDVLGKIVIGSFQMRQVTGSGRLRRQPAIDLFGAAFVLDVHVVEQRFLVGDRIKMITARAPA